MFLLEWLEQLRAELEKKYAERGYITLEEFNQLQNLDFRAHVQPSEGFSDYTHRAREWDDVYRTRFESYWRGRVRITDIMDIQRRAA